MNNTIKLIEVEQPIGSFYIGKLSSSVLNKISIISRRSTNEGIQRQLGKRRVEEIAKYCEDPDATFPTPIILAINTVESDENGYKGYKKSTLINEVLEMEFDDEKQFAEVLDGQHRILGIAAAGDFECEMMVAIVFDVTEEEKAYIFSTINSNQTKVSKSIIYDLFELSEKRSPYKTCHHIARILNSTESSPFYKKLKMLGKKIENTEVLSQGTFVEYLVKLISKKPKEDMIDIKNKKKLSDDDSLVLRSFFIDDEDDVILKLVLNYFSAVNKVFSYEWDKCLVKTTGFGALLKLFPDIFDAGLNKGDMTTKFFEEEFSKIKGKLNRELDEIIANIGSGEKAQKELLKIFRDAYGLR